MNGLVGAPGLDADEGLVAGHQRLGCRDDFRLSPLDTVMADLMALRSLSGLGVQLEAGVAVPMTSVCLQGQEIVATTINDGLGHAAMAVECVGRHDFVRQIKKFDNLDRGFDLVVALSRGGCGQAETGLGGKGGDSQRRAGGKTALIRAPECLTVDGNDLAISTRARL